MEQETKVTLKDVAKVVGYTFLLGLSVSSAVSSVIKLVALEAKLDEVSKKK